MTTSVGRVEVNLCRLLSRCEAMASENNGQDWRLEKVNIVMYVPYVLALTCVLTSVSVIQEFLQVQSMIIRLDRLDVTTWYCVIFGAVGIIIIIIIINEHHSNIIVNRSTSRLQQQQKLLGKWKWVTQQFVVNKLWHCQYDGHCNEQFCFSKIVCCIYV